MRAHPLWDGRVWTLQVVELQERWVQLRALVSAASSGQAWDLRCAVREQLLAYLAETMPESLPRERLTVRAPRLARPADGANGEAVVDEARAETTPGR